MPFALIIIGLVLVITGYQNTYGQLGSQLKSDFTGSGNFLYWVAAIGIVGAIGYVPALKNPSRLFLFLILLSFVLKNSGVFAKFTGILSNTNDQLNNPTAVSNAAMAGGMAGGLSASGIGSQAGASILGGIGANIGKMAGGSSGEEEGSAYGTAVGGLAGAAAGSEYGD